MAREITILDDILKMRDIFIMENKKPPEYILMSKEYFNRFKVYVENIDRNCRVGDGGEIFGMKIRINYESDETVVR